MNTRSKYALPIFLLMALAGCIKGGKFEETVKLNQYMVQGMKLYRQHCANCHQVDGTGLARLYPPLKDSDYLQKLGSDELSCQIRQGLEGEIMVNDIAFNQLMPGIPQLTALEIAEIVTYVNNTWGAEKGLYNVKKAQRALDNCEAEE